MEIVETLSFVGGFTTIHFVAYIAAGVVLYQFSADIYTGTDRALTFMRDMSTPEENNRWMRLVLPTQLTRGILMAIVLTPLWGAIAELSFPLRAMFLFGLMFVYTDISSGTPFANNIEGVLFLRKEFINPRIFLKIQAEALLYCVMFAVPAAWLLF